MSRDFIGSQTGRAFRQSSNRDRLIRTGTPLADWLVHYQIGGTVVLLDGATITPTPPDGFVFEDLRQSATNNVTTLLFPSVPSTYARVSDVQGPNGDGSREVATVTQANLNPTALRSRMPDNNPNGLFRITLRCWGITSLANAFNPTSAASFQTRLGFRTSPPFFPGQNEQYLPPDYTVYDKNSLFTFNFGFGINSSLIANDYPHLTGIPLNAYRAANTGQNPETKELYLVDRIITATVSIRPGTLVEVVAALITRASLFTSPDLDGAVLETDFANGRTHQRFTHRGLFLPNGGKLNPASPFHCLDNLNTTDGSTELRTNIFRTSATQSFLYSHSGITAYMAPLERILAYEPPTLTELRRELVT